ncbi:hypothetical protein EDD22DRAFT_852991 [Suillus occidentalis]|nr:hypothetical protein EDD22DRAFT_852991 [Suillus occidentalis]
MSSSKRPKAKCKVIDDIPVLTGRGKMAQAADNIGLVSLQLTSSSDSNAPTIHRSGRPGAETGGRNAQLEKNHIKRAVAAAQSISDITGSTIKSSCQRRKKAKTTSSSSQVELFCLQPRFYIICPLTFRSFPMDNSGESNVGGEDDNDPADSDDVGEREFGRAEVGKHHYAHPEPEPSPVHVTSTLAPDFDFQYSYDEVDVNAKQRLAFSNPSSNDSALEGVQHVPQEPANSQNLKNNKDPGNMQQQAKPNLFLSSGMQPVNNLNLLYEDLSIWHSKLKKNVVFIASTMPGLIPPPTIPPQEHASCVEHAAAELKVGSKFLCDGVDEQFICILDSLMKNGNGRSLPNFTAKEYGPTYSSALKSLENIVKHPYYGPKLIEQLQLVASCRVKGNDVLHQIGIEIILD